MYRHDNRPRIVKLIEREAMGAHLKAYSGKLHRRRLGMPMRFRKNNEIFGESEPVDYVYEVAHGAVRTVKGLSDGRRLIGGFYFAGEIFGLEDGSEHSFSADAIVDSSVLIIRRSTLIDMAAHDRELARQLMIVIARQITQAQNHALMLVKSAQERVGSFLLEMADRTSIGNLIRLPMPRQDIADYLGVTIETVCRTLTILESASAITLPNSRVVLLRNRSALAE